MNKKLLITALVVVILAILSVTFLASRSAIKQTDSVGRDGDLFDTSDSPETPGSPDSPDQPNSPQDEPDGRDRADRPDSSKPTTPANKPTTPPNDTTSVSVLATESCGEGTCYSLSVLCKGLPAREALIRETLGSGSSQGSILFTTEGLGEHLYADFGLRSDGSAVAKMFTDLHQGGFDTYEVSWPNKNGFAQDSFGEGLKAPICAYAEVTRWIESEVARNSLAMCATGNSGGSMQIGYGLALYGLENVFDFVVLTGGPPTSDAVATCLGPGGDSTMSWVMGWTGDNDYCQRNEIGEEQRIALEKESLVSDYPGEVRDYSYPNTLVSFVEGEKDVINTALGRLYYDVITTSKLWKVLPGVNHGVPRAPSGSGEITSQMLQHCKNNA